MANDAGAVVRFRSGVDGLADDLTRHRTLVGDRNACHARALGHLRAIVDPSTGDAAIVGKLERSWRERHFTSYYERPLLLLAAMRMDAMAEGAKHPLHAAFAVDAPRAEAVTREAIVQALAPSRLSVWLALATRRVQTNDVSRSVAWRWPALLAGCDGAKRPLALFDIGASAGLNLVAERLDLAWTDERGAAVPVARRVQAVHRVGFDPSPLDVRDPDDVAWMRACIWPGEAARLARFDAAVAAMRAAHDDADARPRMHALHAGLVPSRLDALARSAPPDAFLLAYQTMVRGYIEPEKQESYARAMHAWLASLEPGRAAWIDMDMEPGASEDARQPAEIVAHVHVGGRDVKTLRLARCGYHPTEIAVDPIGAQELARVVQPARAA